LSSIIIPRPDLLPGTIIILNGASSSGKTSLLRALQDACETPLLDLGIDRFIWALPGRYLDRPLWDDVLGRADQAGETGHRLVSAMHHAIRSAALQGWRVIADHVLIEPAWLEEAACLFIDLPVWLVGVRCPLETLEARERARRNRTLGQARRQFELIHRPGIYDVEVDTSVLSPEQAAAVVLARVRSGNPPAALAEINRLRPGTLQSR
jgi:chloramphenicol 3-O phosphotransferase